MPEFKPGLLQQMKLRLAQQDPRAAASYREGLRDAEEFFRLLGSMSADTELLKKQLLEDFSAIVNKRDSE